MFCLAVYWQLVFNFDVRRKLRRPWASRQSPDETNSATLLRMGSAIVACLICFSFIVLARRRRRWSLYNVPSVCRPQSDHRPGVNLSSQTCCWFCLCDKFDTDTAVVGDSVSRLWPAFSTADYSVAEQMLYSRRLNWIFTRRSSGGSVRLQKRVQSSSVLSGCSAVRLGSMTSTRSIALVFRSGLVRLVPVWHRHLRDWRLWWLMFPTICQNMLSWYFDSGRFLYIEMHILQLLPSSMWRFASLTVLMVHWE